MEYHEHKLARVICVILHSSNILSSGSFLFSLLFVFFFSLHTISSTACSQTVRYCYILITASHRVRPAMLFRVGKNLVKQQ